MPPTQTETPPAETAPSPESRGPIPYDRHEAALKNARTKTETDVTQRFQQQYGDLVAFGQGFQADPVGWIVDSVNALVQHPQYGQPVISALARALGSRRGQGQPAVEDQEPQADVQAGDGTLLYSAEQMAKREAWQRNRLLAEVDQRLQPLQTREQQLAAQEKHAAATKDAMTRMGKVLDPYKALPEYEEHKDAIAERTATLMKEGHDPATALGLAFTQILREVVLPKRAAQSQQQLTAQAVAKATGSTSIPGATPAAPAGRPRSFEEGYGRITV